MSAGAYGTGNTRKARLGPPEPSHAHGRRPGKSELLRAPVSPHLPSRDPTAQRCTSDSHLTLGNQRDPILHKTIADISPAELISVALVPRAAGAAEAQHRNASYH